MLDLYTASAGSGKTYTLTRDYIRMLLHAAAKGEEAHAHHRILAVTFTKKATAEMKERIVVDLAKLADPQQHSDFLGEFARDRELNMDEQTIRQTARKLLIHILQDYSHFSVTTIDAFFQQVVRQFAVDMNLPSSYDISMDEKQVVEQAVEALFQHLREAGADTEDVTAWLTQMVDQDLTEGKKSNLQGEVVDFSNQLLKETLMMHMQDVQAFFSDKAKVKQYKSTLETFIADAEAEVETLSGEIADYVDRNKTDLNSKIVGAFLKGKELLQKGFTEAVLNAIETSNESICKATCKGAKRQQHADFCEQYIVPFIKRVQELRSTCLMYKMILENLYVESVLQSVAYYIEKTNNELGRVPISDVNMLIHKIIDGQDAPFIYERIGQRYHHYMIDEFQDTSIMQWENFKPLIEETISQGYRNMIVGDVKQSIYRFRNSEWRLLHEMPSQFNQVIAHNMGNNWRTAPLVVEANEDLIRRYAQWLDHFLTNDAGLGTGDWGENIRSIYAQEAVHQEAKKQLPGVFRLQFYPSAGDGNPEQQALESLPELIHNLNEEGFSLGDIAILMRKGKEVQTVAEYLIGQGFAVQSQEGLLVSSCLSVQLVLDLLRRSLDNKDEVLKAHISQLRTLTQQEEDAIAAAYTLPLYEQVDRMIAILQLDKNETDAVYLTAFKDIVYQFSGKRIVDVQQFLEWWQRHEQEQSVPSPKEVQAIRVMTIHKSKGLEFPVVIMPWLNWSVGVNRNFYTHILWCTPPEQSDNTPPLVAISAKKEVLNTPFRDTFIHEFVSEYIDNLNLTYVAFTRAQYRVYGFGEMYSTTDKGKPTLDSIGSLLSYLYEADLDKDGCYCLQSEGDICKKSPSNENQPLRPVPLDAYYTGTPIGNRLKPRSRSIDDFDGQQQSMSTVQLGILMHECLSHMSTFADSSAALDRMRAEGLVTEEQVGLMQTQLTRLEQLITTQGHGDWFDGHYTLEVEHDILTTTGNVYRPDRVMIDGKQAVVIDYKFGGEHKTQYHEQVRDYMLFLRQMGYETEGWLVYVMLDKMEQVL